MAATRSSRSWAPIATPVWSAARLSWPHAPRRAPLSDAGRPLLSARRFPHRPDPAGGARADHPRPFRPCPRRPRRGAGDGGDAEDHGGALRRRLRRLDAGREARRDDDDRRGERDLPSRPATSSARRRSRSRRTGSASSPRATTSARPTRPACRSCRCPATSSSPRRPSGCRSSAIRRPEAEIAKLIASLAQFPERAHLVGAYSLGKAQRVIRMLRDAGYDRTIYLHGSMERLCRLYEAEGIALGPLAPATVAGGAEGRVRRRGGDLPALGDRRALGAALSRPGGLLRLGLDAHPPARQAGRRRAAARSSPTTPTGTNSPPPSPRSARARSGSPTAARKPWSAGARSRASRPGRSTSSATRTRRSRRALLKHDAVRLNHRAL